MESLAPGMHVAGKYVLQRPLARGAMGEVWIGTHASLGDEVAIKFLARGPAHDGEDEATAMARFRFEAQVAAKLARKTRHIVGVTDHGEEHDRAYLVMELVEGESLEAMMRREHRCSLRAIAPIVSQVCKGLSAAHAEGVFHRDLKPANVLLTKDEDGGLLVKILDFGIAKTVRQHKVSGAHQPGHETEIGIVLGTPNYMSPEQARGLATLDHRCDLWALSTIAYEALTGTLPYDGETTADLLVNICSTDPVPPRHHRADLPRSADAFFAKAFAASVNKRYQDAAALAAAFAEVVADAERAAEILPPVEMPAPQPRNVTDREVKQPTPVGMETAAYEVPRRTSPVVYALIGALLIGGGVLVAMKLAGSKPAPAPANTPEPVATQASVVVPTTSPAPSPTSATTPTPEPTQPKIAIKPGKAIPSAAPTPSPTPATTQTAAPAPSPTPKPIDKGEIL